MHTRIISACLAFLTAAAIFAESDAEAGSRIVLRHTSGSNVTEYQYLSNAVVTRLERLGEPTRIPKPWNLIDRESGAISIVRPHNQTIIQLAADAFDAPGDPDIGDTALPPEIPPPPNVGPPPGIGAHPAAPGAPRPPGSPSPPRGAGMPSVHPGGAPAGLGGMPPAFRPTPKLVMHEETREIQGHSCTLHTMDLGRSGTLELWLADSPDLPPFSLLLWQGPQPFGNPEPLQNWPHVVRAFGKFPMLAILRESRPIPRGMPAAEFDAQIPPAAEPPPREIMRWEVNVIEPASPDEALFVSPEDFFIIAP